MRRLISPEDMQRSEKAYFENTGVPSISVMEKAAAALAELALERFPEAHTIYLACGPGGNGGDGYACARQLHQTGRKCTIIAPVPAKSADAVENARRAAELGIEILDSADGLPRPDLWMDCLYGTGLSRAPEGKTARLIQRVNSDGSCGSGVIAADIPSGLNGRTGAAYNPCICADLTLTFQYAKYGHFLQDGLDMCGEVIVAKSIFPEERFMDFLPADNSVYLFDRALPFPRRTRNTHKGSYGHLLIIAGSFGMAGAAALCARAALRSGVGLVTVACPESIIPILQTLAPQAMCIPMTAENVRAALSGKSAVAIGPGLTRQADPAILRAVLESGLPAVIDADALNILSVHPELQARLEPRHVLTPHPGEAARLLGRKCIDPVADARALAALGATVVLKGASRVIASERICFISTSGGSGMARGGSGDVFTGVLGALLAHSYYGGGEHCAAAACELHGQAGELAQQKYGSWAMNSADIIEFLPEVFKRHAE